MKTHLIIPARLKSTRLPNKPLLLIHGKPMILWTADKAAKAVADGVADDYCVATDDNSIFELCQSAGVPVIMTSSEHISGTDRLGEVVQILGFADDDVVINMQGDEPLIPSVLLQQVKDLLIAHSECVMATLCEVIDNAEDFNKLSVVKVVKSAHNHALYFSRAAIPCDRNQSNIPANAYRHLGLYAYRAKLLMAFGTWQVGVLESLESLEQLRVLEQGERIAIDVAKVSLPLGVDTQADLDRLNAMAAAELDG
ncbi:MAG: 3-deoxy-manno-octulosonate cytidylyltransferase [Moraxella sp.]|nr:3-deoxy-manno-octulosonate cytidylyltransferase [Moraxella sp.]